MKSRLDFFVIFSQGLPYQDEILSIIRNDPNFKILYIEKKFADNVPEFVESLYKCDTVPLDHLRGKTKYLLEGTGNYLFILVKNLVPDEKLQGDGEFRHIQCMKVNSLKKKIRLKFNPSPDNHVIHGSDYETQVKYFLDYLGLPDTLYFTREPNPEFNLEYFVQPFGKYIIKKIPLDSILVRNGRDIVNIKDSFHFKYLCGNKEPYREYIKNSYGIIDHSDHCVESFEKLISDFYYERENFIVVAKKGDNYIASDGNHRAAILYHRGVKEVEVIIPESFDGKLNLNLFFQDISNQRYVILRRKEWLPAYYIGEDVDILTDDYAKMAGKIINFLSMYKLGVTTSSGDNWNHIDVIQDDKIYLRFDIQTQIKFSTFHVNPEYTDIVMDRRTRISRSGSVISVPNPTDDLVLRYFEYRSNPHKINHLNYVRSRADDSFYSEVVNNSNILPVLS